MDVVWYSFLSFFFGGGGRRGGKARQGEGIKPGISYSILLTPTTKKFLLTQFNLLIVKEIVQLKE